MTQTGIEGLSPVPPMVKEVKHKHLTAPFGFETWWAPHPREAEAIQRAAQGLLAGTTTLHLIALE